MRHSLAFLRGGGSMFSSRTLTPETDKDYMPNCGRRHFLRGGLAAICLLMAGCELGPDYHLPSLRLPDAWLEAPITPADAAQTADWWKQFNDPILNDLVDRALGKNLDLRTASARLQQSRANERATRSDIFPSLNLTGSGQRSSGSRRSGSTTVTGTGATTLVSSSAGKPSNFFQTGFDASWEIDLFGRLRRRFESAQADREAAEAEVESARLSVAAEIVRVYVDYRLNRTQRGLAQQTAETQANTSRITESRYKQGVESRLEVSRATAQLESTLSEIPRYEALAGANAYRLDLLLGENPGATKAILATEEEIPFITPAFALDAPLNIVTQRPDLKAAERRLAASTALQGAALADLFPSLSLSGLFGYGSNSTGNFFTKVGQTWSAGADVLLPLIDFGRLRANISLADARTDEALAAYELSVKTALQEVESGALAYLRETERRERLFNAARATESAMKVAQLQYKEGILSQLDVLEAQRSFYSAQLNLAQSTSAVSTNLVALYKALGYAVKMPEMTKQEEKEITAPAFPPASIPAGSD